MTNKILPMMLMTTLMNLPMVKAAEGTSAPEIAPATGLEFKAETIYFVSLNGLRLKFSPDDTSKTIGLLSLNDKIKVINPSTIFNGKYVEVRIVRSANKIPVVEKYFLNKEFLSAKLVDYKEFTGKYFIVVNVATETLRLYERVCLDNSCPNKMIMETEVVVGEDVDHPKEEKGKGRSILGSYRVTGWAKFYQDAEGHYPAWYKDGYPATPASDASWNEWFSKKVMPKDLTTGKPHGDMRGAFGWYTAFVAPEPFGQWTHGTLGWGSDKDTFIKKVKKPLINLISSPRSSGCTRNNNEAIAFLRQMIDVGAPIIKVYAQEQLMDPTLSNYPNMTSTWNYVMTKSKSHEVSRESVLKTLNISDTELDSFWEAKRDGGELILDAKSPLSQIIEVGSYEQDTHPDITPYTPGEKIGKFRRKLAGKGNVYGVKSNNMHGTFYIDTGVLENYAHPTETLEVSGFADEATPPWMKIENLIK
jgi:hypothetical protein